MTKRKMGAPTKYDEKMVKQAGILCSQHGYTNRQLADFFMVDVSTIYNWKNAHPDFFDTLKVSKSAADSLVERSLYERATGYFCPEDKIFNNDGEALVVPTTKHYPPDVTACIFWLKNRKPEEWREKPEPETPDRKPIEIKISVAEPAPTDMPDEYLPDK